MHEPRPPKKVYDIYERYHVSRNPEQSIYSTQERAASGPQPDGRPEGGVFDGAGFFDDPPPFGSLGQSDPPGSSDARGLRSLQLLNSLFADRLDFLQRALDELQGAQREREQLARDALEELDFDILDCERTLAALLDPDRKEQLRRRLLGLKGERRREKLLTWRDIVWLRGEIRKLQRDAEAFGRTAKSAENRDAPRRSP